MSGRLSIADKFRFACADKLISVVGVGSRVFPTEYGREYIAYVRDYLREGLEKVRRDLGEGGYCESS